MDTCGSFIARPIFRGPNEQRVPIRLGEPGFQIHQMSIDVIDPWIIAEELTANLTDHIIPGPHDADNFGLGVFPGL